MKFSTNVTNEWWRFNALVVQPVSVSKTLDAGTETSPVGAGYTRLAPSPAYSAGAGFGWTGSTAGLEARDRGTPAAVRQDFVLSLTPATLRVNVPAGSHSIWLMHGDQSFDSGWVIVDADGVRVLDTGGATLPPGQYGWGRVVVDGGAAGRTVDLTFSNSDAGKYWRVNALIVQ